MPIPTSPAEKRNYKVSEDKAFRLHGGATLYSLDDLSEAINLIDPENFRFHVAEGKNDFANWVEHVFDEPELAAQLREHPTPLRMMVSIERFLRTGEVPAAQEAPSPTDPPTFPEPGDPEIPSVPPTVPTYNSTPWSPAPTVTMPAASVTPSAASDTPTDAPATPAPAAAPTQPLTSYQQAENHAAGPTS